MVVGFVPVTGFDDGATLADRFRSHASVIGSPLYAALMVGLADDWDAGGPVRDVCAGHEQAPAGAVVQLRLLAGLHRLVLERAAPELATFYPTAGGHGAPQGVWPVARAVVAEHVDELRRGLASVPQTNEVGRSAALVVGLLDAVARAGTSSVRLLEVGASAGLNLNVDRYRVEGAGVTWGPAGSPLRLTDAVVGDVRPGRVRIASRRGCDLLPVDASTPAGRLLLSSYVWPDQLTRFERLRAAFAVLAQHPVQVDRAGAGEWLEQQLAVPRPPDEVTVVWHSISRMYWPAAEVERVRRALDEAGRRMLLARVELEHGAGMGADPRLDVQVWRDGAPDGRRTAVATAPAHGVPVRVPEGSTAGRVEPMTPP